MEFHKNLRDLHHNLLLTFLYGLWSVHCKQQYISFAHNRFHQMKVIRLLTSHFSYSPPFGTLCSIIQQRHSSCNFGQMWSSYHLKNTMLLNLWDSFIIIWISSIKMCFEFTCSSFVLHVNSNAYNQVTFYSTCLIWSLPHVLLTWGVFLQDAWPLKWVPIKYWNVVSCDLWCWFHILTYPIRKRK